MEIEEDVSFSKGELDLQLSFIEGQIDALTALRKEFERGRNYKNYSDEDIQISDVFLEIDSLLDIAKSERKKINAHN